MHPIAKNNEFRRLLEERRQAILANPKAYLEHEVEWASHPHRERPLWLVDEPGVNAEAEEEARAAILAHVARCKAEEARRAALTPEERAEEDAARSERRAALAAAGMAVDEAPLFHPHEIAWAHR